MAFILKANKISLFVSSVLFVCWYHSPNVLDTPYICNISRLRVIWSLTLREERRLRVFENRVLRRVFGPKRDEVTGEW
jgi:hypothetical protein